MAARDLSAAGRRPRLPLQVGHGLDERHPALHADRFSVASRQPRPAHVLHHVCLYRELHLPAQPRRGRARQVLADRPHAGRLVAPVCRPAHAGLLPDDAPRCKAQLYGERDRPVYRVALLRVHPVVPDRGVRDSPSSSGVYQGAQPSVHRRARPIRARLHRRRLYLDRRGQLQAVHRELCAPGRGRRRRPGDPDQL